MRCVSPHRQAVVLLALLGIAPAARATAETRSEARVIVLRATEGVEGTLTDGVDEALLGALRTEAGFGRAELSPMPLPDLGLAAGCDDTSRSCLARIAETVDADVVLVRELRSQPDGAARLALTSFDTVGAGAPIRDERVIGRTDPPSVRRDVRALVRGIYDAPPRRPTAPPPADGDERGVSTVTWATLGAGGAVLVLAGALGILADDAHEAYAETRVGSDLDAERAADRLDTARDRALAANVAFGAAGALLGLGATLLVVDLVGDASEGDTLRAGIAPAADGAAVWLSGTTEAM